MLIYANINFNKVNVKFDDAEIKYLKAQQIEARASIKGAFQSTEKWIYLLLYEQNLGIRLQPREGLLLPAP